MDEPEIASQRLRLEETDEGLALLGAERTLAVVVPPPIRIGELEHPVIA